MSERFSPHEQVNDARRRVVVLTWFHKDQPGFLDFSYRIRSLAQHFRVRVISRAPITADELNIAGVEYSVVPVPTANWVYLPIYWAKCAVEIARTKPHAVIALATQLAGTALMGKSTPFLVYWNEHPSHFASATSGKVFTRPAKGLVSLATYAGARSAYRVMPIGEAHRELLLAHGTRADRVKLINMGVADQFAESAKYVRPFEDASCSVVTLIYTGSICRERGRDVMLEGLALANRVKTVARLILVGADPVEAAHCKQRAHELGIAAALEVIPRVSGGEIPSLIARADAGVCLMEDRVYWRVNPPTKLFEYLAAGIPVLASRIESHTPYLRDGETGIFFDYSPEGFAAGINRLRNMRDHYAAMRTASLLAGETYLWSNLESKFLELVEGAVRWRSTIA